MYMLGVSILQVSIICESDHFRKGVIFIFPYILYSLFRKTHLDKKRMVEWESLTLDHTPPQNTDWFGFVVDFGDWWFE
jgi:hypothetical protein